MAVLPGDVEILPQNLPGPVVTQSQPHVGKCHAKVAPRPAAGRFSAFCRPPLAEPIETQKIITALTGDWNGDGAIDLAMIVETEPNDAMDMHFFLRDKHHNFLKPAGIVHDKIYGEWNGYDQPGYEGTDTGPELTALPNGSIKLYLPARPAPASGPTRR